MNILPKGKRFFNCDEDNHTGKEMLVDYLGWPNTIPSVLMCYQGRTLKEGEKGKERGWLKKLKVTKGSFVTYKRKSLNFQGSIQTFTKFLP